MKGFAKVQVGDYTLNYQPTTIRPSFMYTFVCGRHTQQPIHSHQLVPA